MKPVQGQRLREATPRAEGEGEQARQLEHPHPPSCLACSCLARRAALPSPPPGQAPASTGCRSKDPHPGQPHSPRRGHPWQAIGRAVLPCGTWWCVQAEEGREQDSAHSVPCSLGGLGTGWSIKGTESDRGSGETGLSDKIQGAQLNLKFK